MTFKEILELMMRNPILRIFVVVIDIFRGESYAVVDGFINNRLVEFAQFVISDPPTRDGNVESTHSVLGIAARALLKEATSGPK